MASSTDDGRTFTVTGLANAKSDEINADLAIKQKVQGQTLTTKLFTSGSLTCELKLDKLGVEGLKSTILGGVGKNVGVGSVEYCQGRVGFTAEANYYAGPSVSSSLAVALTSSKISGFGVVGGEVEYDASTKTVSKMNAALSYFDGKESECTLHISDKAKTGMLGYAHQVRPGFSVAGQMKYDMPNSVAVLTMGTSYRLDGASTVKGKVDSTGNLALTYIQTIRPGTTLTMSTSFDVKKLDKAKAGFSVALE